jgi:hypothetical protein
VIKLPLILLFAISSEIAYCQYTYFNNVYEGNITGTLQCQLQETENQYVSIGLEDLGISRRVYSIDGLLIQFQSNYLTNTSMGVGSSLRDTYISFNDGVITGLISTLEDCTFSTNYPGIVRLDNNLDTLWTRKFHNWSICDTLNIGVSSICVVDEITSAVISKMQYNNGHPAPIDSSGMRITKFSNLDGTVISDHFRTLPFSTFPILQTRFINGFYYILGTVVFEPTNPLDYQTLLLKVNENAEIVDQLEFGNPNGGWEKWPQMEVSQDQKIILNYELTTDYDQPELNVHVQHSESRIARIDPATLTIEADVNVPLPYLENWIGGISKRCILQDGQQNILLIDGVTLFGGEPAQVDLMELHLNIITKLSPELEVIWQHEYNSPDFGDPYYFDTNLIDMIQTSDNGYLCGGVSYSDCCQKHWLLKLDNCGYEEPMGCPAVVDAVEQNMAEEEILLWPNPCNNILKARLPNTVREVRIIDQTGRIVMQENVYFPNQEWKVGQLTAGVYYLQAIHMNGSSSTKMLLKN